jgi:hypothetical protein
MQAMQVINGCVEFEPISTKKQKNVGVKASDVLAVKEKLAKRVKGKYFAIC